MTLLKLAMDHVQVASYDALARQLCESFPDVDWPKPRSLGTRLGQLDKGDVGWWTKRPEFSQKLSEVLQCDPEDFGVHAGTAKSNLHLFDDFPELPPIDVLREAPCELGHFRGDRGDPDEDLKAWFGLAPLGRMSRAVPAGVTWLFFPPGTGLGLFWERLRVRSPYECRTAKSIASVAERLKRPDPICLCIRDSEGERDLVALASRDREGAVLVCAPFDLSKRERAKPLECLSWQFQSATPEERARLMLTNPSSPITDDGVERYRWRLHPDWRLRLLSWVGRRLSQQDSRFDAAQLEAWLKRFDNPEIFDSPAGLIAICRFAHRFGCRNLPSANDRDIGGKLLTLLSDVKSARHDSLRQLVHGLLFNLEFPWGDWIDARSWRAMAPMSEDARGASELVDALVSEGDAEKRAHIAKRFRHHLEGGGRSGLIDSDFVLQNELGNVRLRPRFLVDLIARDHLGRLIREESHSHWGALYFEPSRRELVDQALSLLTLAELANVATRLVKAYGNEAPDIGAAEAVFCAFGLRDACSREVPLYVANVAELVLRRLLDANPYEPTPWSSISSDASRWRGICWTWSIAASPPFELPHEWSGYFPGWADLEGAIAWGWVPSPAERDTPLEHLSSSDRFLLSRAEQVADGLKRPAEEVPEVLIPYLLVQCVRGQRSVPSLWWETALENAWAEDLLVEQLEHLNNELTPWLISLIECLLKARKENARNGERAPTLEPLRLFMQRRSRLRFRLFERSRPSDFFEAMSREGVRFVFSYFDSLPNHYQAELLERLRTHPTDRPTWFELVQKINPDLADAVVPWLGLPGYEGGFVAIWLWSFCPAKAEELLVSELDRDVRRKLIEAYDGDHGSLDCVLKVLEQDPQLLPAPELRQWIVSRLPRSGFFAPRLLALLKSTSLSSDAS